MFELVKFGFWVLVDLLLVFIVVYCVSYVVFESLLFDLRFVLLGDFGLILGCCF